MTASVGKGLARSPAAPVYIGVLLCSLATLMQEVLLTRIFSLTIWYHLAYLTISTALLGFGAAGSLLAANPRLPERHGDRLPFLASTAAGLSLFAAMWLLGPRPIDPSRTLEAPAQTFLALSVYYLIVAVPFFFAGLAIATTLSTYPERADRLYAADLLGAGLGCAGAVAVLTWLDGSGAIAVCVALFFASGAVYATGRRAAWGLWVAMVLTLASAPVAHDILEFVPSATKAMGRAMREPGTTFLFSRWSPINRVDVYRTRYGRDSWIVTNGLSDSFRGPAPRSMSIQYDGHNGSEVHNVTSESTLELLDYHILRTPYLLLTRPRVLVIGVGGGIDVQNAVRRKARRVVGVDLQPITIELHKGILSKWTGDLARRPGVELVAGEGRHYVRTHDDVYDLVQLTFVDTFSAQSTGAYVLAESYLYTVEAIEDYLSRLSDGGVLCIVMGDLVPADGRLPPPLVTRLALIGREALERRGIQDSAAHIVIVAQRSSPRPGLESHIQSLLIKRQPFLESEVERIRSFAGANGFEVRLAPKDSLDPLLERIVHAPPDALAERLAELPLVLAPTTDDRPFFFNVLPWGSLVARKIVYWMLPGSAVGQMMLLLMLVQSVLFGAVLILVPLARAGTGSLPKSTALRYLLYFFGLGLGFMLVEISFIQKYVLVLGYPTYSLSVTLFSLLLFAALGAYLSRRGWSQPRRFLCLLLGCSAALVVIEVGVMPMIRSVSLSAPLSARIAITTLLQLPLGLVLGMYFPTGLEMLRRSEPRLIPWAWAVNGVASVVAAVLAVIVGMQIGFSGVALLAVAVYGIATLPLAAALPVDASPAE